MMAGQARRLLGYMASGNKTNTATSYRDVGILRLAARIHDIESEGFKVSKKKIQLINSYNEKVTVTDYYLSPSMKNKAKEYLKGI